MKKRIVALFLAIMMVAFASCTTTVSDVDSSAATEANLSQQITSENELGESDEYKPFTLTTYGDANVTFTKVPERIISTNANTGELLMAMGLGDKIIGTCYNNAPIAQQYREEYELKPVLAEKAPTLEIVLAAEPDFVYGRSSAFGENSIGSHDMLTEYGISSLSSYESYMTGISIDDLYKDFYNLGKIFQIEERADEVVSEMQDSIAGVQEKIADKEPVKVFIYDAAMESGIYTPGNNFASELIRLAGGVNVFQDLENTWNTVTPEAVVKASPDIIIVNDYAGTHLEDKLDEIRTNPAFADIPAVKNDNIISITLPEVFASARAHETVEKFAVAFHPEAFAE